MRATLPELGEQSRFATRNPTLTRNPLIRNLLSTRYCVPQHQRNRHSPCVRTRFGDIHGTGDYSLSTKANLAGMPVKGASPKRGTLAGRAS